MFTKSGEIKFYNLELDRYELLVFRDRAIDFIKESNISPEKAYMLAAIAVLNTKGLLNLDETNFRPDGSDRRVGK